MEGLMGDAQALTTVLLSNRYYAHLSRILGFDARLKARLQNLNGSDLIVSSERVLAGLFEAYVALGYKVFVGCGVTERTESETVVGRWWLVRGGS
jgi:hypothetical protein